MELTGTHLRYLLSMYQLSDDNDGMRLTQIAKDLNVKKASVARIINVFREKELVEQRPYGKVHLTKRGRRAAVKYNKQVGWLADSLQQTLPLSRQEAYNAACMLLPELPDRCIAVLGKTDRPTAQACSTME